MDMEVNECLLGPVGERVCNGNGGGEGVGIDKIFQKFYLVDSYAILNII